MTEEDPDLLAGENLDELRGRNPMSERFRLWQELENAKYQNNLLAQRCRELEQERDEARREVCQMVSDADESSKPESIEQVANRRGWECYKEEQ
jgi:CRISPR/Cas system-associated endonuclease Cas1